MIRYLLLASFSLALSQSLYAAPAAVSFTQSATTVDAFDFVEVSLNVTQPDAANPFTDATVAGEFAREGGEPVKVDGFCDAADGSVLPHPVHADGGRAAHVLGALSPGQFRAVASGEFTASRCQTPRPTARGPASTPSTLSGRAPASITSGTARPPTT
jgi:hypothetical protein